MAAPNKPPVPEEASKSATMTKDEIAYLLLRVTLGANLFLHGLSRLIGNHAAFATHIESEMQNTPLPGFLVHSQHSVRFLRAPSARGCDQRISGLIECVTDFASRPF